MECTEYLINKVYIKVGNNVYHQTIGIPMETNSVPLLENLFQFHYEYSYMKNLVHDNLCMAKWFSDTVRYIDDLLTLNNSKFSEEITNIYSTDLMRELVSQIPTCPTWIFQLVYGVVNMLLWSNDKRDAFNFNIVNFTYMSSNIPANPTYGASSHSSSE